RRPLFPQCDRSGGVRQRERGGPTTLRHYLELLSRNAVWAVSPYTAIRLYDFSDFDSSLLQLFHIRLEGDGFIRRARALLGDPSVRLHHPGDRERVAGRPHHRADPGALVVAVEQLPRRALPVPPRHLDAQRDQVPAR